MRSSKSKFHKGTQRREANKRRIELNDFDLAINSYSEKVKQKLDEEPALHIYDIPFVSDSYLFCLLQYIYSKQVKTADDLFFIQHYLTTFQTLIMTLFKKKQMTDPKVLLAKITYFLNFEQLKKGSIICRYGDPGDKFYLIFNGSIAVLITKQYKANMTQIDYIKHLQYLYALEEYELALQTISSNIDIYDSKEVYDIKYNVIKHQENSKEISASSSAKPCKGRDAHYDVLPIEEYISRIIPKESIVPMIKKLNSFEVIKEEEELNEITAWVYFQVAKLEESQTFGDVALSDAISKRTASIICLEDSSFGSLDIQIYKKCIRTSQEVIRRLNIECILTNPLFEGLSMDVFNKKYFNYFRLVDISLGDCLFSQSTKRTELFFLKEGEIQLLTSSSLSDINSIMKHLGQDNRNQVSEMKMLQKSKILQRYFTQIKPNIKLIIYNQRSAIGLDDCMYNDNYFITAKCQSQKASVYAVEYNFFMQMVNSEKRLDRNISSYLPLRKNIMNNRLKQIKDISLFSKLNAMNEECYQNEEPTELDTIILKSKASIPQFKTSFNQNYFREKHYTESDLTNNVLLKNKGRSNVSFFKDSSAEQMQKNMTHEYEAIPPTNYNSFSPSSRMENYSKTKLKSILSSPARDCSSKYTLLTHHNQNSKFFHSKKISLNLIKNIHYINAPKRVENIKDTRVGNYIESCDTIKGGQRRHQIINGFNCSSRNQLIKIKRHLTEGVQLLNHQTHLLSSDKRNDSLKQSNELILSQIDCLAFDHAIEQSQVKKETINTLKGKKLKIKLSKIKGKHQQ